MAMASTTKPRTPALMVRTWRSFMELSYAAPTAFPGTQVALQSGRLCRRQTTLNRFVQIPQQFLKSLSLRCTARDGRHLGPISALFGLVHHDFEIHGSPLLRRSNLIGPHNALTMLSDIF